MSDNAAVLAKALRELRRLKGELSRLQEPHSARCPVAVVGAACRLPGADSPEALWTLLVEGRDATRPAPPERPDAADWLEATPPGDATVRKAGFLDDLPAFDARAFDIPPREAQLIDPQQRLALICAREAIEHAGIPASALFGARAGVFMGCCTNEYPPLLLQHLAGQGRVLNGTYAAVSAIAGRVAYTLGLQGPTLSLDTACSSSLVAIHLAVRALQQGDCDLALAGGVNVMIAARTTATMAGMNMLSRRGQCRAYDADADGFTRGEGCGVLALKRLDEARRDGDRVLAVVRGTAVNQDGRSAGLTAPNKGAQVAALRQALQDGGLDPLAVSFVEGHGTGTPLGDPIEVAALAEVFAAGRPPDRPLRLGAIKTNLGHLESAAGVAGALKVILALQRGVIPPNLHFDRPNPHIPWADLPLEVPREALAWEGPGRVAGVSSFGFTGTNAHLLLSAPDPEPAPEAPPARAVEVLPLSARSPGALRALAARHVRTLEERPEDWPDLAVATALGREALPHRLAVAASGAAEAAGALRRALAEGDLSAALERTPRAGFLFTGQGAQEPGMGAALYASEPAFAEVVDRCDALLAGDLPFTLRALLCAPDAPLQDTRFTQPAMFTLQVALAALWARHGVLPEVVLGHSVGALAAAVVAGALDLEDGLRLAVARGRLMGALPPGGAMAALACDEARARALLERVPGLALAAVNGPEAVVVSGPEAAVEALARRAGAEGLRARRLPVSHAFHSALMEPALADLEAVAATLPARAPALTWIDDRSGEVWDRAPTAADWALHARQPTRFLQALRTLGRQGCDALVELGPRPVLLGMAGAVAGEGAPLRLPSLRPGQEAAQLADSLGRLWRLGLPVDWRARNPRRRRWVDVPLTPMQPVRCWPDPPDADLYALRWLPRAWPGPASGRWLIVAGAGGEGEALARRLEADGARALRCDAGEVGAQLARGPFDGLVDLVGLDLPPPAPDEGPAWVARAVDGPCASVLATVAALEGLREAGPRVVLVTRRAIALDGEAPDAAQAARWGLGRTLAREHAGRGVRLLDIDADDPGAAADQVARALGDDEAPELALRGAAAFAPRLDPCAPAATPGADDDEGTTLITGGTGALGLRMAEHLAARGVPSLALVGRSPPSEEATRRIEALRARGVAVRVLRGDVSDPDVVEDLIRAIQAEGPPLRRALHLAGVLDDGLLGQQTPARLARVFAPKVAGAWNLHRATADAPEVALIWFSSVAGLMGNAGQGGYAAANAALDALAAALSAAGRRALSIQWGPWAEQGMAAALDPRLQQRSRARGLAPLSPDRALRAFDRLQGAPGPAVAVMALDGAAQPEDPAAPPSADPLRERLLALPPAERAPALQRELTLRVARSLDRPAQDLDPGEDLSRHGLDSLLVMELLTGLQRDAGVMIYPREFYQAPTVEGLARRVLEVLSPAPEPAPLAEPAPSAEAPPALDEGMDEALDPPAPVEGVGFILSPPRCGSTLLRVMLAGHPQVFAPPELWLLQSDDLARRRAALAPLHLDEGYVIAAREALGCSTEEALARVQALVDAATPVYDAYAALRAWSGGRLVLDKTPGYALSPPTLARVGRWFVDAPAICLLRHPLAAMASYVQRRMDRLVADGGAPWDAAEEVWTRSAEHLLAFAAAPGRARPHPLRFEDLVTRPRAALEALCAHLGLPFVEALLHPFEGERMRGGLHPVSAPLGDPGFAARDRIDPTLAEAWRAVVPPRPLRERTRAVAEALGYDLPPRRDRVALADAPDPPRADRVQHGELGLATLSWGPPEAPCVLAVHGLLDHAGVWAPLGERLAARGLRLLALDLRGHGCSDHAAPSAGYPLLDHVLDLARVSRALAPRPALLLGHSMGAAVASLYAAARHPGLPLVLVEPPGPAASPHDAAGRLARWLDERLAEVHHPVLPDLDALVARLAAALPGVSPERLRALAERASLAVDGGLTWRWDARLLRRADLAVDTPGGWPAPLAGLSPTLVFAEDSALLRPEDRAALIAAAGTSPRWVPGGHHPPLTAVEDLAALVLERLDDSVFSS